MARVLLSGRIHDAGMAVLAARSDVVVEEMPDGEPETFVKLLPTADALIIRTATLPREALVNAPRLKVVARHGVGYDNVPVDALTAHGIPLALAIGANADSVAEHVLYLMLAIAKRGPAFDRAVRGGDWEARNRIAPFELRGRTLLIIGFGRVGRTLARQVSGLAMRILAFDPIVSASDMAAAGAGKVDDWRAKLCEADVISLHLPRTRETENMIGTAEIALMKREAILINTARGGLVDEDALAAALNAGLLAGAGIDTFADEPPLPGCPLLGCERAILSPHNAGLTGEAAAGLGIIAARNALAGIDGRLDPALLVNPSVLKP